jgi:hypothetical protein
MASAFLSLADAVVALLSAGTPLAGGRIRLGRGMPLPSHHDSGIDVDLVSSRGQQYTLDGQTTQWETSIGLDVMARAAAGANGAQAVDALLEAVFARLAGATPPAGAMSWALDPSVQWSVEEADRTLAVATLSLRVTHFTGGASLAPQT